MTPPVGVEAGSLAPGAEVERLADLCAPGGQIVSCSFGVGTLGPRAGPILIGDAPATQRSRRDGPHPGPPACPTDVSSPLRESSQGYIAAVVAEASLERADGGLAPDGDGWFVLNARDARWMQGAFDTYTRFEGDEPFPQLGVKLGVLAPGHSAGMYHGEDEQENFLVLSGACLLLIEGQRRSLRAWDFVHCPPWTEHVFVGVGAEPCVILAVGSRSDGDVVYPVSEMALEHGAGVQRATRDPREAYASAQPDGPARYREDWLPGDTRPSPGASADQRS